MRLGLDRRIRIQIFPPHTRPMFKRLNKGLVACVIITFICVCLIVAYARIRPLISKLAESKASYIATMSMNEAINMRMLENDIKYDDLIILQKGLDGQVIALSTNVANMNRLKSVLAMDVQQKIASNKTGDIEIPLGSLSGSEFLEGVGPRIPIKLVATGFAVVDFKSSFTSAGINQTKHEISIEIKVTMGMVLPTGSKSVEVTTQVPVAHTIIVGNVPQSYTNIEGVKGDVQDIGLEMSN